MSDGESTLHSGACLCGKVAFQARDLGPNIIYCHCSQCLKTHGNYAAYARVLLDNLTFTTQEGLQWYQSSDQAKRGFCSGCGASLFWAPTGSRYQAVSAGCLDQPTGLSPVMHIFVGDQGDYYRFDDGLPCYLESTDGPLCDRQGQVLESTAGSGAESSSSESNHA
ncbi:GFA family protein [Rhodovibrionaceae bacterium A322]